MTHSHLVRRAALVSVVMAFAPACRHDASPTADGGAATLSPAAASASGGACATPFEVLAPFQKYSGSDLIREIAVDGDQVYFRTFHDTFRVALAGGAVARVTTGPESLDGSMWVIGDKLVIQSGPQFLAVPKRGGAWTPFLDTSTGKAGAPPPARPIGRLEAAQAAVFDGTRFTWIEGVTIGASLHATGQTTHSIKRVPAAGGAVETLYTSPHELRDLASASGRLVFQENLTPPWKPSTPGEKKPLIEAQTWSLMTLPLGGGSPEVRFAHYVGANLVADGTALYFGGLFENQVGMWRLTTVGTDAPERVDPLVLDERWGAAYGSGQTVFVAGSMLDEPGPGHVPARTTAILTGPSGGHAFAHSGCVDLKYGVHAEAVAGKWLLLALFSGSDQQAGLVKIALP
jgi:hypothetical protein